MVAPGVSMIVPRWRVRLQQVVSELREPPNLISLLRMYFFFWVAGSIYFENYLLGLINYLGGAFTDFLDGWLARKTNNVTDTGKALDPVMDKLFFMGTLLVFWFSLPVGTFGTLFNIALGSLIILEVLLFVIGVSAFFSPRKRLTLGANRFGKGKTVSEFLTACVIFFAVIFNIEPKLMNYVSAMILFYALLLAVGSLIEHLINKKPA